MAKTPKIVAFDLNKTLYKKSSKEEFFKYICFQEKHKVLNIFQVLTVKAIGKLRLMSITSFKENFFKYLNNLPPDKVNKYAHDFWKSQYPEGFNKEVLEKLKAYRKEGVQAYIITGGLEVYASPLLDLIKVDGLLGTQTKYVDNRHKIEGKACKAEEKINRLDRTFGTGNYNLIAAYSDENEYMLDIAKEAYLVKKGEIIKIEK